jgi:hypothetical protein
MSTENFLMWAMAREASKASAVFGTAGVVEEVVVRGAEVVVAETGVVVGGTLRVVVGLIAVVGEVVPAAGVVVARAPTWVVAVSPLPRPARTAAARPIAIRMTTATSAAMPMRRRRILRRRRSSINCLVAAS